MHSNWDSRCSAYGAGDVSRIGPATDCETLRIAGLRRAEKSLVNGLLDSIRPGSGGCRIKLIIRRSQVRVLPAPRIYLDSPRPPSEPFGRYPQPYSSCMIALAGAPNPSLGSGRSLPLVGLAEGLGRREANGVLGTERGSRTIFFSIPNRACPRADLPSPLWLAEARHPRARPCGLSPRRP
jgi:hypothetical protein